MMKVLIVPAWFDSNIVSKGLFIQEFAKVLNTDGNVNLCMLNIQYFSIKNIFAYWRAKEPTNVFDFDVLYVKIPNLKSKLFFFLSNETILKYYKNRVLKEIERKKKEFDVIHCQSLCNNITPYLVSHLSQDLNLPYIVTEHYSSYKESAGAVFQPYLEKKFVVDVAKKAIKRIAVSNFAANKFESYFGVQFESVNNIINEYFVTNSNEMSKKQILTFITVGALESHKGVMELLAAFKKAYHEVGEINLVFVGQGSLKPSILKFISENEMEKVVSVKKWLNKVDLIKEIDQSHVLISASIMETFGLTIVEALLRGLPVIATKSGGPCEFIEDNNGVLVELDNKVEGLCKAIIQMHSNYSNYNLDKIQSSAKAKFKNQNVVDAYKKIYEEAIIFNKNSKFSLR